MPPIREHAGRLLPRKLEPHRARNAIVLGLARGGDQLMPDLAGRTVIVVDNGVATGATAREAARSERMGRAEQVVLAAPVIAAASEPDVSEDLDDVVAVAFPRPFFAVGARPVARDAEGLWTCEGARGWTARPSP